MIHLETDNVEIKVSSKKFFGIYAQVIHIYAEYTIVSGSPTIKTEWIPAYICYNRNCRLINVSMSYDQSNNIYKVDYKTYYRLELKPGYYTITVKIPKEMIIENYTIKMNGWIVSNPVKVYITETGEARESPPRKPTPITLHYNLTTTPKMSIRPSLQPGWYDIIFTNVVYERDKNDTYPPPPKEIKYMRDYRYYVAINDKPVTDTVFEQGHLFRIDEKDAFTVGKNGLASFPIPKKPGKYKISLCIPNRIDAEIKTVKIGSKTTTFLYIKKPTTIIGEEKNYWTCFYAGELVVGEEKEGEKEAEKEVGEVKKKVNKALPLIILGSLLLLFKRG